MAGYAPNDESENRIYGMKKGLEFISHPAHTMTEENIFRLYEIMATAATTGEGRRACFS